MLKVEDRATSAMKILVRSALAVIQSRSAAQKYPEFVADKAMCGVDCGDFGHSKQEFKNIITVAESWIDSEVSKQLKTPMKCTGINPHFSLTMDKGTPGRETNQATMIMFIHDGKRIAVPVGSPAVYKANIDNTGVTGGTAEELASSSIMLLKENYKLETAELSYCQGIIADGQYQSAGFRDELKRSLPFNFDVQPVLETYFSILWDPGHFSDLAFSDVREGKIGNSKEFLARIIKRSNVFGSSFHSGKHLSELQMVAKTLGVRAHLVKSYSMTRFTSSSYSLLANIIESYSTYLEAFRNHQYDEIKEFMVSGHDYVIDLCSLTDVMKPFVKMMILLQSLQYPGWKVVSWWKKVEVFLSGKNKRNVL